MVARMIDAHRLRVWRAVVASGSVQAAARHLGFTPSTVSQHVQQLQRETRLVLAERVGRGLRPTPAGLALAAEAERLEIETQRLEAVVADLRQGRSHELAVSCAASVAQSWMPRVASRLQRELPGVVLEVSINEPHEGRGRRTPDIAVRSRPPHADGTPDDRAPEGYTEHPLTVEDFVVVVPADSPLAGQRSVRMSQLASEPWIDNVVYEQSPTVRILLTAAQAAGFTPRWSARCDDHLAAVGLVAAGHGVTAFPTLAAWGPMTGTVTLPLTDPTPRRELVAWQRGATAHTRASRIALEALIEVARGAGRRAQTQMMSGSTRRSRPTR